jgi:glyoxylase-like metal-dependent hydrolase (beta-lactamase superfamily II)
MGNPIMVFKQLKYRGDNFSYIIADDSTRKAVVVDPSGNQDVLAKFVKDQKLRLEFIINTHGHGDHTAGNDALKGIFGAKIVAHRTSNVNKDLSVDDGDVLNVGKIPIKIIHTPGHTPDSISLLIDGKVLTGDTLFIGECGRTDLSGGNPSDMYHSLFDKLAKLDDKIEVYPGHDYGMKPHSTIGEEKRTNYVLEKRTLHEFLGFMSQP